MSESIRHKRQREEKEYRKVQRAMNGWGRNGRTNSGRSEGSSGWNDGSNNTVGNSLLIQANVYRPIEEG